MKQKQLLFIALFTLMGLSAWAQTFTQGSLKFTVLDTAAKTVSVGAVSEGNNRWLAAVPASYGNHVHDTIVIPAVVRGYKVTTVAKSAFGECRIDGLVLPEGITDIKELRDIQLGIMDDVHRFCEAQGLRYSLSSGTLIGAVRHQGYIPWDDDIDIYMMRDDYERFLKTYHDEQGRYRVLDPKKEDHYYYTFAKVVDQRTKMPSP